MSNGVLLALAATAVAAQEGTTLVVTVGTQNGFFQSNPSNPAISGDVGPMNPHDYRPNEFVANDFIFEGLVAWDGDSPAGPDGILDTEDDYTVPSLATSWTTAFAGENYVITFTLRPGVTFHDGSAWNAAVAVKNFEQIMGGTGVLGSRKVLRGMHDWLGFTKYLDAWAEVDEMTFSLTFTTYYEAAFRELAAIRPFRMSSVAALPMLSNFELSHTASKGGKLRNPWPNKCDPSTPGDCFMFRGVSEPIGTGPYRVVDKLLSSGRRLPAAQFNSSCYAHPTGDDKCVYNAGEYVKEVLFTKFAGHWKNPSYDNVILRSYPNQKAVADALKDGTLDIAYGVSTLSPSAFISLATAEGGSAIVAHQSPTYLNVRNIVINSGSIPDQNMRKFVMGVLAAGRQALYDGELAEEKPMDTLFDPESPHCGVLKTLPTPEVVAATGTGVTSANFNGMSLRLLYRAYEPHAVMIAAEVQALLFAAGIKVTPMATRTRDEYNNFNCDYTAAFSYGGASTMKDKDGVECADGDTDCISAAAISHHTWDLSISQTWGPPYDPTAKLWDMTHQWCSAESDAPAVTNMASMTFSQFKSDVQSLSNIKDKTARTNLYSSVLTTLHNEAIFLPITAKRQTAATNVRVSGFKFGFMEFDLPLANLYPTTGHSAAFSVTIAGNLADITTAKKAAHKTAVSSSLDIDKSKILITYASGSVIMTVTVYSNDASEANAAASTMSSLSTAALGTALGETVTAISTPVVADANSDSSSLSTEAIIGIAVAGGVALLFCLCLCVVIQRERAGAPMFTTLTDAKPSSSTQSKGSASSSSASSGSAQSGTGTV